MDGFSVVRRLVLLMLLSLPPFITFGQCPISDFSSAPNVCLDEQVQLHNNSQNAATFEWSFCTTDFNSPPSTKKLVSNYGAVYYSKFIRKDGNVYLFFVSSTQNKLVGLLINNLENLDYQIHCEIDLSGFITNAAGFDMVNENGTWIALIGSIVAPFKLVKITLDQNIQTVSDVDDLSAVAALFTPFDIKIEESESNYFAFIANNTAPVTQQLIKLSFGSSLSNVPVASYIGFPTSTQAASLDFYHSCDAWTAFISSRNGKIFRADFGSDFAVAPTITELTLSSSLSDPAGLAIVHEHDVFFLLIQSRNGNTYTGTISSIADNTVDIVDFGNIKSSSRDWDVEVLRSNGSYKIAAGNFTNGGAAGLYALNFQTECPANMTSSANPSEIISFNQAGTFKITLMALNETGDSHVVTKELTVSNIYAPNVELLHPSVNCVSSPVSFSASSDVTLTGETWDFGDGSGQVTDPSPVHAFANSGNFIVTANVTSSNGCNNFRQSSIAIYGEPAAAFSLPSTLLCTNNIFTFSTTTPDIYDGNLSYQWFIDGIAAGTDRDLQYVFTSTGTKDIKLVTSIPGCASEITTTTSSVEAGPVVDFSFAGVCEDDTFSFNNLTTDPVTGYLWDFGNGNTSASTNAEQVFADYGDYAVSLTATNAVGCENITTKMIKVHAQPSPVFLADGPPNSCSDTPTQLVDQSSSPDGDAVTQWLWDFGDASSDNAKDPTHTFSTAGFYNVSLTVTSEAGCSANLIQPVDIYQSPSIDFSFSPTCDDLPAVFTPPADNSIVDWYWEIGTSYYTTPSPSHTFKSPGNYPLYLEVTASNGCESSRHDVINVPIPLNPDFSYLKNCVGQEAVLTDVTTGSDPVLSREWTFDSGEAFSGSPVNFVFDKEQTKTVTMKVTAASGCSYSVSKQITILPPPVAGFTADPSSGAYPLETTFTNTSFGATHYLWNFNDGSGALSTDVSPIHTFEDVGSYEVKLTAFNSQECESTFLTSIGIVAPLPDADIENISLTPNADGSLKLIVTIHNKGNTILKNLPLDLDFSGMLKLRQVLEDRIDPGSKFNFVFSTGIVNPGDLRYVCASADIADDLSPAGNRVCKELDEGLDVFQAFPNPASGVLNIEWVQSGEKTVRLSLVDTMGRMVFDANLTGSDGLNRRALNLDAVESGIYYLVIRQEGAVTTQKIAVSTRL
jgi:PKD repeat protein